MTYVLSLSVPDAAVREQQLAALRQQVELVKDPVRLGPPRRPICHSTSRRPIGAT